MKKTMFITSVIMVVVMAIALTTSSLAWFSAQGQAQVTTTALTVKAQSNSSSGLVISHNRLDWGENVALTQQSQALMAPLVPIKKDGIEGSAATSAELLAALSTLSFIGNKAASGKIVDYDITDPENALFGVPQQQTIFAYSTGLSGTTIAPYYGGYYEDDVFVASISSGSTSNTPSVSVSCVFQYKANVDAQYATYYTTNTQQEPSRSVYQDNHPVLYVAVLADIVDGDYEYAVGTKEGSPEYGQENWEPAGWVDNKAEATVYGYTTITEPNDTPIYEAREKKTWELIQVFSSASTAVDTSGNETHIAALVPTGNVESKFASGKITSRAVNNVASGAIVHTSNNLAKAVDGADHGLEKRFKVVAWYDGATLNNNNSGFDFNFALTFSTYTGA